MVMKPDGSRWMCGHYLRLNLVTTKVDLSKGYHQIRMHAATVRRPSG
jgi:hypothetical protein